MRWTTGCDLDAPKAAGDAGIRCVPETKITRISKKASADPPSAMHKKPTNNSLPPGSASASDASPKKGGKKALKAHAKITSHYDRRCIARSNPQPKRSPSSNEECDPVGVGYGGATTGTGAMPRPDGLDPVGVDPTSRIPKGCNPFARGEPPGSAPHTPLRIPTGCHTPSASTPLFHAIYAIRESAFESAMNKKDFRRQIEVCTSARSRLFNRQGKSKSPINTVRKKSLGIHDRHGCRIIHTFSSFRSKMRVPVQLPEVMRGEAALEC